MEEKLTTVIEWIDAEIAVPPQEHDVLVLIEGEEEVRVACYANHYIWRNDERVYKTDWGHQENGFEYHHFLKQKVLYWAEFPFNPVK